MTERFLFLDRDGVINRDYGHQYKISTFDFIEGIFSLCTRFQSSAYRIVVITNQAGIAKGYYTVEQFNILTEWMIDQFAERLIHIEAVKYCPHHPEFTGPCYCRKPNPGMFLECAQTYNINFEASCMIGDKITDIQASLDAGIGRRILYDPEGKVPNSYLPKNTEVFHNLLEILPK